MAFSLKNAPSEFQNIMNDIFNSFSHFTIVYIDDVCSDIPNAFWHRKKHIVDIPYVKGFDEKNIPTKLILFK